MVTTHQYQVKDIVKNFPSFLATYSISSINPYICELGYNYQVIRAKNYSETDIICNLDNEYLALGGEDNSKTIEVIDRLSYSQQLRKEANQEIEETECLCFGDIPELLEKKIISHIPLRHAFISLNSKVLSVEVKSSKGKVDGLDYPYLSICLVDDINNEFIWDTPILKAVKVDGKNYFDLQYTDNSYDNCIQPGDSLVLVGNLDSSQEIPVLVEEVLSILIPAN